MIEQKFYPSGKKNILVTGCAGFLGSHLCDELIRENHVIGVDNLSGGGGNIRNIEHLLQNPDFKFLKFDVNEPLNLEDFPELAGFKIKIQGIQEIYHLACPTTVKNFEKFKIETIKSNSLGIINLLEMTRKYKAKFLFTSSSVVYGPAREKDPYFKETDWGQVNFTSPRACYDEGKRFAESIIITYRELYGLEAKIARVFRTYGPRMPLFDGQMLPDFVLQALNDLPLIIYGDENFRSSFCYVSDIIDGLIELMNREELGPINLGHPESYKVVDLAKKIIEFTNSHSEIVFKPPLLFMTPLGLPDITLAKKKLEWFPLISLEDGLKKMIEDIEINRMLFQPFLTEYQKEYEV